MFIVILSYLLLLFPSLEREKEIAYEGSIVLESKEVLTGTFYFEEKEGLLYRRKKEGLEIFPVYAVKALYFYDARENINRQYIKLVSDGSRYPYQLYEVVLSGEVKVLRKRKSHDYPLKNDAPELVKAGEHAYNYHYFVLFDDELVGLSDFSREVFPHMFNQHPQELNYLVEGLDWNVKEASGAIQLIKKYNQLSKLQAQVSCF